MAVLVGLLPWVVVVLENGVYPLFSVGFLYTEPLTFTSLPVWVERTGTVPPQYRAWPVATTLWLAGIAAAGLDMDRKMTAGLLALAAGSVGSLALALSRHRTVTGIPVGALALGAAAVYAFAAGRE
ncbi:TIGR04206 family protein [Halobacterium jilantaiense]|uniref:TIGR04206 family protein n=1 Tax=Halobacterium jilantaiense TaxID=355548 RepID=UPI001FDF69AD|nr:TIGR04206 family protein [Halobacterium jilantaiense]